MADKSKIEWCDATWNPAVGCEKVSDGCARCYAERMAMRFRRSGMPFEGVVDRFGWTGLTRFFPERLEQPFHWRKPRKIFVCSMGDLFHESLTDEQIAAVFGVMAATPQHQYVVLTKRLQRALEWFDAIAQKYLPWINMFARVISMSEPIINIRSYFQPGYMGKRIGETSIEWPLWPLHNVIICASVENQPTTYERVSLLFQIPARWRGVSVEPMLEGIDFRDYCEGCGSFGLGRHGSGEPSYIHPIHGPQDEIECGPSCQFPPLDLVICGAETGPGKRPFKDEWALDLRDQCKAADTPFFFKKDGSGKPTLFGVEYHEWPED
jgi:protein gp37